MRVSYLQPGMACTVTGAGDLGLHAEARPYLNALCVVVKVTKAGMVQVAKVYDRKHTISVPPRNIETRLLCVNFRLPEVSPSVILPFPPGALNAPHA